MIGALVPVMSEEPNLLQSIAVVFGTGILLTIAPYVILALIALAILIPLALAAGLGAFVVYCGWLLLKPIIVPACEIGARIANIGFHLAVRVTQGAILAGLAWGAYRFAWWMLV